MTKPSDYKTDAEFKQAITAGLTGMSNREERQLFLLGLMASQNNAVLQELERIRNAVENPR